MIGLYMLKFRKICVFVLCSIFSLSAAATNETAVAKHYVQLAHAVYKDTRLTAQHLGKSVDALIANPSEATLAAARSAWKQSRIPYLQSEAFRFGNPVVDAWEGQLNAWPLDEGLIDYVDDNYLGEMGNIGARLNIIATTTIELGDVVIDTTTLTPELLASLNELGGSEANVATGYHAIEFLLWGQDLNGTHAGAGDRPYTDFVLGKNCSNGHCARRNAYLKAAVDLLIADTLYMEKQWAEAGEYNRHLATLPSKEILTRALYGIGSLSLGELAGERLKVALEANSTEDEQDCFSDNTHLSHYFDAVGIRNVYLGEYKRIDGTMIQGPSIADLVQNKSPAVHKQMLDALNETLQKMQAMVDSAESGRGHFDQLIAEDNLDGQALVADAIAALVTQTTIIENVAKTIGITNLNPDTGAQEY